MNIIEQQSVDLCPHCRGPFEIVFVKLDFVALQWLRLVRIAHSLPRIYGVL
jgi:hypothetical protein